MVPMDQPKVGLNMIQTFLQDRRFGKVQSKLGVALVGPHEDGSSSPSIQCPRFLETAPNSSVLTSAAQGSGDTLMETLSLWAGGGARGKGVGVGVGVGGGGKKRSGNLRKSRPTKDDARPARTAQGETIGRHLSAESAVRKEITEKLALPVYCPFTSVVEDSCCASTGWPLLSLGAPSWVSVDQLTGRAKDLATAVLQADIDNALQQILPPLSSLPSPGEGGAVTVVASFGKALRDSGDRMVVGDPSISDGVFATFEVCGRAADVQLLVTALGIQAKNQTSLLRSGLLTTRLDPLNWLVIAHQK